MPQETNTLPVGFQLEEYRVESILGTGGFGITYKARDTHLDAWVAVKEYFPIEWSYRGRDGIGVHPNSLGQEIIADVKTSGYDWGLDRFLYEARVLASVRHDFVVRVRRYFRANGTAYIVMDYEEGEPLSALLRRENTLSESDLRGLLQEVLPALDAVHQKGYLHRDLKPSNLYIRARDGCVMLIDFGAARQSLGRHTKSITGLVTPGYSPPEQYVTRSDRYGPWTDIYALGAVLYRCVTGKPPIEAPDRQMWDSMIPAVEAGASRYSPDLLMVVDRALAMRPEDRFQSVAEMQAALENSAPLDGPSRFTLQPKAAAAAPSIPADQGLPGEPLADLFDLSTPPVSRPPRKADPSQPFQLSPSQRALREEPQASEKLSLPSLSIFDTGPAPAATAASMASVDSLISPLPPPAVSTGAFKATDAADASPLLKPLTRRSTLAQSMRSSHLAEPPLFEPSLPEPGEAAEPPALRSRTALIVLLVLLGVGLLLLFRGFQEKMIVLRQEQQELEGQRQAVAEQRRREQTESQRSELTDSLERASQAIAFKEWTQAGEHLERAESLQPGSPRIAELRSQLREEQRKLGSLEVQIEPVTGMALVKISPGCFQMGSTEHQPERYSNELPHEVCVEGFWISQFEISNAQFRQFRPGHDSGSFRGETLNGDRQPVVNVSWQDAMGFAGWLSQRSGKRYRLPTEAEWEYAARAGTTTLRFWGDSPEQSCRYANTADLTARRVWGAETIHNCDDGRAVAAELGSFLPNMFKLHDMLGNVSEWTCSEYEETHYLIEEKRCSERKSDSGRRVVRGGSWDDTPRLVRSADRNGREPTVRDYDLGFRLVYQE